MYPTQRTRVYAQEYDIPTRERCNAGPENFQRLDPTTERLLTLQDKASTNIVQKNNWEERYYNCNEEKHCLKRELEEVTKEVADLRQNKSYWYERFAKVDEQLDKYIMKEQRAKKAAKKAKAKKGKK